MNVDDDVAIWDGEDSLGAVLNVTSNIFILPAVILALRRHDYSSVVVYVYVFIASNLYHLCRAGLLCVFQYRNHQITDYLFVYLAIIWTLTRLSIRRRRSHVFLFLVFYGFAIFCVEAHLPPALLPIMAMLPPLVSALLVSVFAKSPVFRSNIWAGVTFGLIALAGVFMFILGPDEYWWAHPVWHVFSMSAIFTAELATNKC